MSQQFFQKIFREILTSVQSSHEQDEMCPNSFRFLAVISNLTPIRMTMYKLSGKKPPVAASTQLMVFPKKLHEIIINMKYVYCMYQLLKYEVLIQKS